MTRLKETRIGENMLYIFYFMFRSFKINEPYMNPLIKFQKVFFGRYSFNR